MTTTPFSAGSPVTQPVEVQDVARPRVLVTGAAGFLGSRVVERLSAHGAFDVVGVDVVETARSAVVGSLPRVTFRRADLRDSDDLDAVVVGCTSVVHLAAVRSRASVADPRLSFDVNVGGTYDLLLRATAHGVRRFVYGSSHLVYGAFTEPARDPWFTEDEGAVRRGLTQYAAAKLACEAFVEAFCGDGGPEYVSLRFGGIYGPGAAPDSNSGAMLGVLESLDAGTPPEVDWTRDTRHALVYVDDAARAAVAALETPAVNLAVNVVGESLVCGDVYDTLVRLYGADPAVVRWTGARRRYQLVSRERYCAVLGGDTATPLADGLQALVDWHRAGRP